MVNRDKAIIDFINQCPAIAENDLFFNYVEGDDSINQFITVSDAKLKSFIDGSVLKVYTFTIASYKFIGIRPVTNEYDENMEKMAEVRAIIEWIEEQNALKNFPDFGEGLVVEKMECSSDEPMVNGMESDNPPLAKYSIPIRIEYLDMTSQLWNK